MSSEYRIQHCIHLSYPQKASPWMNLVTLMQPASWAWIFASVLAVVLCFNGTSLLVKRLLTGIRLHNIEIDLYPLR